MPTERELRDHAKEQIKRMINTRGYPLSDNLKAAGLRTAAAEKLAEEAAAARLEALVSMAASSLSHPPAAGALPPAMAPPPPKKRRLATIPFDLAAAAASVYGQSVNVNT